MVSDHDDFMFMDFSCIDLFARAFLDSSGIILFKTDGAAFGTRVPSRDLNITSIGCGEVPLSLAFALERHNYNPPIRPVAAVSPALNTSRLRQSALCLLWHSTQDDSEPVTGKRFGKCAQRRVVTPDSTEPGAASGQLGVTHAKWPLAHHTVSVDMPPFLNSIRVAHSHSPPVLRKNVPLDYLFLAPGANDRSLWGMP